MTTYRAPLDDIGFVLRHVTPVSQLAQLDAFAHAEPELVEGLLAEAGRFAADAIAATNREGDLQGSVLEDGRVRTPEGFKKAYAQFVDAGWGAIQHPVELGGGGFPLLVANAVKEMVTSANMALSLCPLLTTAAIRLLAEDGSDEQRQTFAPRLVTGEWAGTMNLSEPQAGSDLGAVAVMATPAADGTWRLRGQKIFITYGDHDLTEQIVHLVLARTPDAPAGTRGLSVFVVPKYLVRPDGTLAERNDVEVVSLEHKLGIHGSPTCVMAYGDRGDGALAYLVGGVNDGMRLMFKMMNDARLGVGVEGLAISERAYQLALAHARERRQGVAPGAEGDRQSAIIDHADVRRMLLTMRAYVEAMRCLTYANAEALDYAAHHPDAAARQEYQDLADLLTPVSKAWCTDLGVELTSIGIQVHGGMGYIEESGAPQHLRDARIAPIYEGTNGIQAIDLVTRKLAYDGGATIKRVIADMRTTTAELVGGELGDVGERLDAAVSQLEAATQWVLGHRDDPNDALAAATPFLSLFGHALGGWYLARSAAAAQRLLADDAAGADRAFLEAKVATTRFYARQLLPRTRALLPAVTAGAKDLFAVPAAAL